MALAGAAVTWRLAGAAMAAEDAADGGAGEHGPEAARVAPCSVRFAISAEGCPRRRRTESRPRPAARLAGTAPPRGPQPGE